MLFDMKINYDGFVRKFISDLRLLWFAGSNSMKAAFRVSC